MKDYVEIEAYIAEARRLRSQAVGEYMAAGWHGLVRGVKAVVAFVVRSVKPKDHPHTPHFSH